MSDAKIVDTKPVLLDLEPGTYFYCACGHSAKHPFCDGSHKGSGLTPKKFEVTEAKKVAICACKHSGGEPFCDGTHKKL